MARKPRILMINEFSNLNTGFSTYGKEVISRIHASGQYEIAELASYLAQDDPAQDSVEWKVFPVMPGKNSDPEYIKHYNAVRTAQFGELALNKCLMEFQPDIVFSIRDPWFDEFILRNPLRKYFKYAWMVTCDGEPQRDEWLDWYRKCDYIVTYSEWAKNMLTKEGIHVSGVFSPGTDINLYKPNKEAARQMFQIPSEWNIIQTVMRNQPRKLFPDLFHSFALFLKKCADNNQPELADNTYLHIHTSLDDVGYDIEAEIFKYGLDHKVLITYIDEKTKQPYISFYSGKRAPSQITPGGFAFTPNTVWGATKAQLANIHQLADLYVQYSICVTGDTEIMTVAGYVPIDQIKAGDTVWTTGGWDEVVGPIITENTQPLVEIEMHGEIGSLKCTPDHQVLAICSAANKTAREVVGTAIRNKTQIPEPKYIEAGKLKDGDLLVQPLNLTVSDIEEIEIDGVKIPVDVDFCRFLGMFAGDGYAGGGGIKITCNDNEQENIDLAVKIMQKIKPSAIPTIRQYKERNAVDISIYGLTIMNCFEQWFKKKELKQLPDWTLNLPLDKQREIILGLVMADGCMPKDRNTTYLCNTSTHIIRQSQIMLRRLQYYHNTSKQVRTEPRKPIFRIEIQGNIFDENYKPWRSSSASLYHNDHLYIKVKSVTQIPAVDRLYDLHVKNHHNYATFHGIIHNCEGFGMPIVDAKACGVPTLVVPYSAMMEMGLHESGGLTTDLAALAQENKSETGQLRARPDNNVTSSKFYEFFMADPAYRVELSNKAVQWVADKKLNWDDIAAKWMKLFASMDLNTIPKWTRSADIKTPAPSLPQNMSHADFIHWAYQNVLGRPELLTISVYSQLLDQLTKGVRQGPGGNEPFTQVTLAQELAGGCQNLNNLEQTRYVVCNGLNVGKSAVNVTVV